MRREERIKLEDGTLVPVSQGITVPIAEWQALKEQVEEGTLYNSEEIITESGTWTAKATCWHEVTVINGGNGGSVAPVGGTVAWAVGGNAGARQTMLMWLEKGQSVPVVIGAAGLPGSYNEGLAIYGGETSFNGVAPDADMLQVGDVSIVVAKTSAPSSIASVGAGVGSYINTTDNLCDARWYGAGGSAIWRSNVVYSGKGYQGAVIIRWHDPEK